MYITPALLQRAAAGDEAAQASVIARCMPGIRRIAAANVVPGLEREDAEQEGLIALFHAMAAWREDGAGFETYAMRCVRNAITDARLRASRKKHQPLNEALPMAETASTPGPEETAVARETYRATVRALRTGLTPLERQVLLARLDGGSYEAIAARLHITPKAVDNALRRVRAKLKNGRE